MSATTLAHGIHYAIIAVGVGGIGALVGPSLLPQPTRPRDEHEERVAALRRSLSTSSEPATTTVRPGATAGSAYRSLTPTPSTAQRTLLPLAVLGSAAAAGVHAAVGPAHFREGTLFGLFFALSALAQITWAGLVALRCSRALVVAGALGNVAVLVLWATTRTVGLPFGLLPAPEAVGPWDLACGGWELLVVCCCTALVQSRDPLPRRLPDWSRWTYGVRLFALGSVAGLVALSLSGASA